ncbi:MAG: glycosyltransferase [Bacteroidota bacterium]
MGVASKVLIIGHHWPEPTTTAAGQRMLQLLHAFLERDYQLTFTSTAVENQYSMDLKSLGISTASIRLNHSSFDDFIEKLQPDLVIFDRFMTEEQFGWRVADVCPNALRILNTEDLHSLRSVREACVKQGTAFTLDGWWQSDKTKREVACIYRSDLSLLISSFEKRLLKEYLNIDASLLYHLPFMLPAITYPQKKQWPDFEQRKDFVVFGNGKHAPNIDALFFLKQHIWPMVRQQLPQAKLHVYGAHLPKQVLAMEDKAQGLWVHGWEEDLVSKVAGVRLLLAPLRFGAGLKGKLLFAMQCGTPSITTTIGAEGITGTFDWPGAITETSEAFAERAVTFYQKKARWLQAQENGVSIINQEYEQKLIIEAFFDRLEGLRASLTAHRLQNRVGALLHHQTLAATKYMSKWIAAKQSQD